MELSVIVPYVNEWPQVIFTLQAIAEDLLGRVDFEVAAIDNFCPEVEAMAKYDLCGKRPQFGHTISKSQHHTKRQWAPNIQRATVMIQGRRRRVNLCAKCLRTLHKA